MPRHAPCADAGAEGQSLGLRRSASDPHRSSAALVNALLSFARLNKTRVGLGLLFSNKCQGPGELSGQHWLCWHEVFLGGWRQLPPCLGGTRQSPLFEASLVGDHHMLQKTLCKMLSLGLTPIRAHNNTAHRAVAILSGWILISFLYGTLAGNLQMEPAGVKWFGIVH